MPAASSSSAPLLGASRGRNNEAARSRQAELAAAFGGSDDEEDENLATDYGRQIDVSLIDQSASGSSSPPTYTTMPHGIRPEQDVFFDAGDALGTQQAGSDSDPLGAERVNADPAAAPEGSHQSQRRHRSSLQESNDAAVREQSYDFERPSYFTPQRPPVSRSASLAATPTMVGIDGAGEQEAHGDVSGMGEAATMSSMSRVRLALGRFGRFVGMRVPGATYSSLNDEDEHSVNATRRRIMGSGIGQDGVFANLNAKPERRRRRGENGEDLGEDDDLVDDVLPPSYETAAADSAPPYWETTIIGGPGGFHPLAPGGAGWTPGGAHVGALEDLIVEGLPVGNFFGFAWNLLVSMSFQFIGFLLTYLLHTTHAARCGSRAGLGITLVQYGFYLRTRAIQMAEGKLPDEILGPGAEPSPTGDDTQVNVASWFSEVAHPQVSTTAQGARDMVRRGLALVVRQATSSTANATLAEALAADDDTISLPSAESMSASTEWLAYILMGLGWFILLTSLLSYWRVHRWAKHLVDAARRENESTSNPDGGQEGNTEEGENQHDANAPVGFLYTLRNAFRSNRSGRRSRRREGQRAHSAEDWIIFPGRPRRDMLTSASASEEGQNVDLEAAQLSTEERRLLEDMRSVGLIG